MSYFAAEVVPIKLECHPSADTLSIVRLEKPFVCTVVVKTEEFTGMDKACYIPVDSLLPESYNGTFFKSRRVKAVKIRGIVSTGLLLPAKEEWEIGQDVTKELGIVKYEAPSDVLERGYDTVKSPSGSVCYTDIENIRRYPNVLQVGEPVVLTEKCHGQNARIVFQDNQLFVGSRVRWVKEGPNSWWKSAFRSNMPEIAPRYENKIFFGETYGAVQDMTYGHKKGEVSFILFDIYDISKGRYLDFDQFQEISKETGLPTVPIIYQGPWLGFEEMLKFTEGPSIIDPNTNFREGWVGKPIFERYDPEIGRVILKCVSEAYLCRKEK
jgi:RNA ligase (TIGR02306 family)